MKIFVCAPLTEPQHARLVKALTGDDASLSSGCRHQVRRPSSECEVAFGNPPPRLASQTYSAALDSTRIRRFRRVRRVGLGKTRQEAQRSPILPAFLPSPSLNPSLAGILSHYRGIGTLRVAAGDVANGSERLCVRRSRHSRVPCRTVRRRRHQFARGGAARTLRV